MRTTLRRVVADDRDPNWETLNNLRAAQQVHLDDGWYRVRSIRRGPYGLTIDLQPLTVGQGTS